MKSFDEVIVIGGGLAGSEAAWQIANHGIKVKLYEMRPEIGTGAHKTDQLAELVCSNSLGSKMPDRATGVLMREMEQLGSLLVKVAQENAVPAGGALAVSREDFSEKVTETLLAHPNVELVREEVCEIPNCPVVIATGPLTSDCLSQAIEKFLGEERLFFFDALAPIVDADSINMEIAYRASRYDKGETEEGDYINCPLNKKEYEDFVEELLKAERIPLKSFEEVIENGVNAGAHTFFEGCLPIEIIASRGEKSLAFGPMRPVGLDDPRTGRWPHAVLQLRQDNIDGSAYNMVGFQTNLKFSEQKRIFQMIPGLENVEFVRYGQMHRNTFISAPLALNATMEAKKRDMVFFAGQLSGVEGYMGNIATGWLAGTNLARELKGLDKLVFPRETMLGAIIYYLTHADLKDFQPVKANFGIMPKFDDGKKRNKKDRITAYSKRAEDVLNEFVKEQEIEIF